MLLIPVKTVGCFNVLAVGYWGGEVALNNKIPACFLNSDQSRHKSLANE